jgi:sulfide:quinone oxidoreductase
MTSSPFRVVVAGGGVAGLESLLTLHALAGERCELTLIDPQPDFVFRPMAVAETFLRGRRGRFPLASVARETDARLVTDGLAAVDDEERVTVTEHGERVPYDALIVATGARSVPAYEHVLSWDEATGDERLGGLLSDIEQGYTRRVAFVVPPGPGWPLPVYELALMTAERAWANWIEAEITIVTPEVAPLAIFGPRATADLAAELERAHIRFEGGAYADVEPGHAVTVVVHPREHRIEADRVVALPRLIGRAPKGVPADPNGFIAVDPYGKVPGLNRVWAAGDGIDFPVKFGGLAAEQADAAAEAIAALAGADVRPQAFRPVLRGRLLTGRQSRFMRYDAAGGGGEGTVEDHALWWPPSKIAGRRLAPYLAQRDEAAAAGPPPEAVGAAVQIDLTRELSPS